MQHLVYFECEYELNGIGELYRLFEAKVFDQTEVEQIAKAPDKREVVNVSFY